MDLTIHKPTFFKNLKFWSFHCVINAIPSFCIAYIHDWNTVESLTAMTVGIILFSLMWSFIVSLKDVDIFCKSPFISSAITAGIYLRLSMIILSLPVIISFIIYLFSGNEALNDFALATGMLWAGDFVIGMVTHEFYGNIRAIIPISGVHNFFPTVIITLAQGLFLMGAMLGAGAILAVPTTFIKKSRNQRRLHQN